jgi:hypothetical protein
MVVNGAGSLSALARSDQPDHSLWHGAVHNDDAGVVHLIESAECKPPQDGAPRSAVRCPIQRRRLADSRQGVQRFVVALATECAPLLFVLGCCCSDTSLRIDEVGPCAPQSTVSICDGFGRRSSPIGIGFRDIEPAIQFALGPGASGQGECVR